MLNWFEKTAPIRTKFKVLTFTYGAITAAGLVNAWLQSRAPASEAMAYVAVAAALFAVSLVVSLLSSRVICTPYVETVVRM